MTKRRAPKPTRLGGKPPKQSILFRLLDAITRNLSNILRVSLVLGFAMILSPLLERIDSHVSNRNVPPAEPVAAAPQPPTAQPAADSALSDNARQAMRESAARVEFVSNCTRKEFRDANYDACFPGGSDVYPRPTAGDDEGSLIFFLEKETLYATR